MGKQGRRALPAVKHRQRAKIDQGLAKQNLTPKIIQELVSSATKPAAVAERPRPSAHRHPMFWQDEEF